MLLTHILSVASILLGIYLVTFYFGSRESNSSQGVSRQQYHLGCFLNKNTASHSQQLTKKIKFIQQEFRNNISLNMYHTHSLQTPDDYNSKSVKLAYHFQTFIDDHLKSKAQMKNYVSLANAVQKAQQQYKDCSRSLSLGKQLNQKDCIENWEAYQGCFGAIEILKQNLNLRFAEKAKLKEQITLLLKESNEDDKKPGQTNEFEKQYKTKIRLLDEKEKRLQLEIKNLDQKISTKEYVISTLLNDLKHAQQLYYECHQNRKEFKLCEEISKEVRSLGYGEIQKLNQWLVNKFKTLSRLQKMIESGSGSDSDDLKRIFKKGTAEYQEMLKLFIETKVKMNKHCGCSEEEEKKLKENAESIKKQAEQKQKQITEFHQRLTKYNAQLREIERQKEKEFNNYKDKISNIPNKQSTKVDKIKLLEDLTQRINDVDLQILQFHKSFEELSAKCNGIQQRLREVIPLIEKIKDCASKKHFFQELLGRLKRQNPQGLENHKYIRDALKKQLLEYHV